MPKAGSSGLSTRPLILNLPRGVVDTSHLDLGIHANSFLIAWFCELLVGQLGLLAILLTYMFSRTIAPPNPFILNFLFVSLICTFSQLILLYTGEWMSPNPTHGCAFQAIFKHGADAAFLMSVFLVVVETFVSTLKGPQDKKRSRLLQYFLLALPYINGGVTALISGVIVYKNPSSAIRDEHAFYCTINNNPFGTFLEAEAAGLLSLSACLLLYLLYTIWTHRTALKKLEMKSTFDFTLLVRVTIFVVWAIAGIGLSSAGVVFVSTFGRYFSSTFQCSIYIVISLIFGTQKDLRGVWGSWIPRGSRKSEKPYHESMQIFSLP
ncbi:hypothetical protein SISNIDRAFT_552033 [Sistotremastrum niveocremeum HHB9708]|uniref:G-protein coupled receptors family 2 profile 2 domain-containing protein n=1 Tax=Sistotremastrum niveocremeum HHB9708 TaxID=1314777 RepID=A0A164Q910_9AGAM|nr:hypothetical protein SISNIDRAFT_552033 [Sistotremastrum niveocremeum HHB9708]